MNLKLKFSVDYLYECLITGNEFTEKFHKKRKIWGKLYFLIIFELNTYYKFVYLDHKKTEWETEIIDENEIKSRKIEYKMSINEVICMGHKFANNSEIEV